MKALPQHLAEAFEAFWAAYPKRPENPKAPARTKFAELVKSGVPAAELISAAGAYAVFCKRERKDPKFVPHARTWLAQRRFEDWADVSASAPAVSAGPSPEHPLAFLFEAFGEDAWKAYCEPVRVEPHGIGVRLVFATNIARERVQAKAGAEIEARLGPIGWAVATRSAA